MVALQAVATASMAAAVKDAATSFIPSAGSLAAFARLHPTATTVGIAIGVVATLAAALIVWRYDPEAWAEKGWLPSLRWIQSPQFAYGSMMVATASTLALVVLVSLLMVRPSWCPENMCPPTLAAVPGPHDAYIAADVIAIESDTWLISGDPASHTLSHLPLSGGHTAVAVAHTRPIDGTTVAPTEMPYRVVVNVHSLRADQSDLSIESVSLVVTNMARAGRTNVWRKPAPVDYATNPFKALYSGQTATSFVEARFAGTPAFGHVQLKPGETDVLSITVSSNVSGVLTFQVRLEYRYVGQPNTHVFAIPYHLEAAFVDLPDWYEYQLRNGKLEPA